LKNGVNIPDACNLSYTLNVLISLGGIMRYFVIGPDGSKYGPADLASLNAWAAESRVLPSTMLEEEGTGRQIAARDVIGMVFPMAPPSTPSQSPTPPDYGQPTYSQPQQPIYGSSQPQSPYNRPVQQGSDGSSEVTWAWVLGAIGFLCCPIVFSTIGIVLAVNAKNKGHPSGNAAMIFCIVSLVVGVIIGAAMGMARLGSIGNPGY
jgi:hypothetical protein